MIKLGLIGAGLAVRNLHWPILNAMRGRIQVCAVASGTRTSAESVATLVGGACVFDDYRALLADPSIDAVLVAVPIGLNATVFEDAIRSGKHVLAEKPLAATPDEARSILSMRRINGQVIAVAENFRYRDDIVKAKSVIENGEIGDVFAFQVSALFHIEADVRRSYLEKQWRTRPEHPGGFILDAGVHAVAGMRDLLGNPSEVFAQVIGNTTDFGGPDTILMQLKLESGAAGHYLACYRATLPKETTFDFAAYGTRGGLWLSKGNVRWATASGDRRNFRTAYFDKGYHRQWQNFWKAVRGEEPVTSTIEDAFADLMVIDAALRSAKSGLPVRL